MKYDKKIKEQSQNMNEMHQYINLCEERIKQICPDHEIPVTEKHLKNATECLQLHLLKQENQNLRNSIAQKDKVNIN